MTVQLYSQECLPRAGHLSVPVRPVVPGSHKIQYAGGANSSRAWRLAYGGQCLPRLKKCAARHEGWPCWWIYNQATYCGEHLICYSSRIVYERNFCHARTLTMADLKLQADWLTKAEVHGYQSAQCSLLQSPWLVKIVS